MLKPDERTKAALARLRSNSDFVVLCEWLKVEEAVAISRLIDCNADQQLKVCQNTVRVLAGINNALRGDADV